MKNKPKGYYNLILAIDCETSGIAPGPNPAYDYNTSQEFQPLSWGVIVADNEFNTIEETYVEIKYEPEIYKWQSQAEAVHGLSREHLEEYGIPMEDAVVEIAQLVLKYWGPETAVVVLGHNVQFDISFLQRMFDRFGLDIRIAHRSIDTNSIGIATVGTYTSDAYFDSMGLGLDRDGKHNALEDIRTTLKTTKSINQLWKAAYPQL